MDAETLTARKIFWSTMDDVALAKGAGMALAEVEGLLRQVECYGRPLTPKDISRVRGTVSNGITAIMALCARCDDEHK